MSWGTINFYLVIVDNETGNVPWFFPPRRNSLLFFCPFHQKKMPMAAEAANMRLKTTYSSQPNFSISSSRVYKSSGEGMFDGIEEWIKFVWYRFLAIHCGHIIFFKIFFRKLWLPVFYIDWPFNAWLWTVNADWFRILMIRGDSSRLFVFFIILMRFSTLKYFANKRLMRLVVDYACQTGSRRAEFFLIGPQ